MSTLYFADDIWFIQNIYYNLMFTVVTTLIGFQNQHAVGKKKSNIALWISKTQEKRRVFSFTTELGDQKIALLAASLSLDSGFNQSISGKHKA